MNDALDLRVRVTGVLRQHGKVNNMMQWHCGDVVDVLKASSGLHITVKVLWRGWSQQQDTKVPKIITDVICTGISSPID